MTSSSLRHVNLIWGMLMILSVIQYPTQVQGWSTSYVGCFGDSAMSNQKRALPYGFISDHSMSHDMCFDTCGSRGLQYAGMEYGQECWCSATPVKEYSQLGEEKCEMPCEGNKDEKCGGGNAISVYRISDAKVSQEHESRLAGRPLLALVMILKNEAHTLKNTFKTVLPHINAWYILDTGSTDGTQELIKQELSSVPGKLFEEPFVDYGATRNRILDLANQSNPRPIYTLMLSADEQVVNMADLIPFLKSHLYAFGPQHDAYPVVMNTGILFDSLRLARTDGNWRYQGRVHEYLASPDQRWVDVCRPEPDIKVNFQATDNERRFKSQWFIAAILEDELTKKPNDTRSLYYLARTYQTIQNYTASYATYERLAKVSAWDEERYESLFNLGLLCQTMSWDWSRCHQLFLNAHEHKSSKVDVLFHLATYYYQKGKQYYPIAFIYAKEALSKPIPDNIQMAQNVLMRESLSTYQWRAADLCATIAEAIHEWSTCVQACDHWLRHSPSESRAQQLRTTCLSNIPITMAPTQTIITTTTSSSTPTTTWKLKRIYDRYMHTTPDPSTQDHNDSEPTNPIRAFVFILFILSTMIILLYMNRRRKKHLKGK